jgi:hypothetical protein
MATKALNPIIGAEAPQMKYFGWVSLETGVGVVTGLLNYRRWL